MEASYNLSDLSGQMCEDLALELLNQDQKLVLEPSFESGVGFDMWQKDKQGKIKILVQVEPPGEAIPDSNDNVIKKIVDDFNTYNPEKYILISFSHLNVRSYSKTVFPYPIVEYVNFFFYGISWIKDRLKIYPDIAGKYNINLDSGFEEVETTRQDGFDTDRNITNLGNISTQFWWINANKEYWNIDDLKIGDEQSYSTHNEKNNKRKIFPHYFAVNVGDLAIGYQVGANGKTKAIFEITKKAINAEGDTIKFKILEKIPENEQISYSELKVLDLFSKSEVVTNYNRGSIYQLSFNEFKEICSMCPFLDSSKNFTSRFNKITHGLGGIELPNNDNSGNTIIDNNSNDNFQKDDDKIPFHLDQVVEIDKLGREPVAKAFVDLIRKDIFTQELNHSFMVHLQGEWGAGKSSFLKFIKNNLNRGDEKWIVVNYNAWQNQHITPPWWTLIDQIYRQSKAELVWCDKFKLWIKENFWRIIWYSGWQKIMSLFITIALTILLITYGSSIFDILTKSLFPSPQVENVTKGLTIDVFVKLLVSISALIGVIYSFSKFISTPLFMKTSKEADSFMCKASDPMTRIKKHFGKLIDGINSQKGKRQIAIFIDDIDRCNKEYIVQLLEGIQTLFKDKRVLYIVAGDKKWITTSFGNTYKEFSTDPNKSHELGELFLEKAFQLSFRMPNISESAKRDYWNYILGIQEKDNDMVTKIDSFIKLDIELQNAVTNSIKTALGDITSSHFMKNMEVEYNLTENVVSDLIIEEKNNNKQEIQHLLKGFHSVIDANPRSIIRLANNYTMIRSTLIAERKDVSAEKIFRWLVIEDLFPRIKLEIGGIKTIGAIHASFKKAKLDEKLLADLKELLLDEAATKGGSFEMEEIKDIIGF